MSVSSEYKLMTDYGSGFYTWNGNVYQSDIVRSAISIKATTVGKAVAKHIRTDANDQVKINPDVYLAFLLSDPNPLMSGQMLQEKMINQLELNNNAFAYVQRDQNGLPNAVWPIIASSVEALQDNQGNLYLRFYKKNGQIYTFAYSDIIHLRKDYNEDEIFGESNAKTLAPLMEIVTTTDQSIVNAIKNSSVIRWLLKFNQTLRPEDIKRNTKDFVDDFLKTEENGNIGAAGIDAKAEAIQVHPDDFVPNDKQMNATVDRIYSMLHINKAIIQSSYTENQWISWYESQIEPVIRQMADQWTSHLFNRRERSFRNQIVFESSDLSYASMQTKLSLVQFADRGIMSPNEIRKFFNLAPVDGGDVMLLRKDTGKLNDGGSQNDTTESDNKNELKGGEENDKNNSD